MSYSSFGGYNVGNSTLAGVPLATLQQWLIAAQGALNALQSGAKVVTASYDQGGGSRSVTYQMQSLPQLAAYVMQLQAATGVVCRPRTPIRPYFR